MDNIYIGGKKGGVGTMDQKAVELLEKLLREIQDIKVIVQESLSTKDENIEERVLREVQDIKVIVQEELFAK